MRCLEQSLESGGFPGTVEAHETVVEQVLYLEDFRCHEGDVVVHHQRVCESMYMGGRGCGEGVC